MKRALIFAAYAAVVVADVALAQNAVSTVVMTPRPPAHDGWLPPGQRTPEAIAKTAVMLHPQKVVINYGRGGRVDHHRATYARYEQTKTRVEIRGPCYSACTLVLAYVEPEHLCIAEGAFMAFHAIRSGERGERMEYETYQAYQGMPPAIKQWITDSGGWDKLPLNGFWTLHSYRLWELGYGRCP